MPHQFKILEPDLFYLQRFPVEGRGYLFDYGNIPLVNPYDKKPHTMAEMVKGILVYDPLLELLCSFKPRPDLKISDAITRYISRVVPKDYVSDLPKGSAFTIESVDNQQSAFGRNRFY